VETNLPNIKDFSNKKKRDKCAIYFFNGSNLNITYNFDILKLTVMTCLFTWSNTCVILKTKLPNLMASYPTTKPSIYY
jgi:hypothetical protein